MTKSGTQERTILPEKTPVKKASLFISKWATIPSQLCENTTKKQAKILKASTQPIFSLDNTLINKHQMVLVISELNQKDSHLHLNRHYSSSRTGIVNRLHSQFFTSYDRRHNLFPIPFFQIMPTKRIIKLNPYLPKRTYLFYFL